MGNTESTSVSKRRSGILGYGQLRLTTSNGDLHEIYRVQNVQGSLETLDSMDEPPRSVVSAPGFLGPTDDNRNRITNKKSKSKKGKSKSSTRIPIQLIPGSPYMLSHTNAELDRTNVQHFLAKELRRTNIMAPIPEEARILDVGCSNGAWVLDVALENKNANIIGVDFIEVFPKEIKPKNTTFRKANVLDGLPFKNDLFDLIHVRFMMSSFRNKDWPRLLEECYRVCKPNGYVELTDIDGEPLYCGPQYASFCQEANKVFEMREIDPYISRKFGKLLSNSGFTGVESSCVSAKIGEWGAKHGALLKENMINTFHSAQDFFTSIWGIQKAEFDNMLRVAFDELDEYEGYYNICTSFGRKPSKILHESSLRKEEMSREQAQYDMGLSSDDNEEQWSSDEEGMGTLTEKIIMKPEEKDFDEEEQEYDENNENDENDDEVLETSRRRFAPKYQLSAPTIRRLPVESPTFRYPLSPTFEPKNTYE